MALICVKFYTSMHKTWHLYAWNFTLPCIKLCTYMREILHFHAWNFALICVKLYTSMHETWYTCGTSKYKKKHFLEIFRLGTEKLVIKRKRSFKSSQEKTNFSNNFDIARRNRCHLREKNFFFKSYRVNFIDLNLTKNYLKIFIKTLNIFNCFHFHALIANNQN